MGKKDLYFILAFALLLGANFFVADRLKEVKDVYYEWNCKVRSLKYDRDVIIKKKDEYLYSSDVVRCNKTAKKLESLCRKKDEATCRKYVEGQLREHYYEGRLKYFSSQCEETGISFDLIDSLAIVLYAERVAHE